MGSGFACGDLETGLLVNFGSGKLEYRRLHGPQGVGGERPAPVSVDHRVQTAKESGAVVEEAKAEFTRMNRMHRIQTIEATANLHG